VEQDIWRYYQTNSPGQVQVLGADLYNGTPSQVRSFKDVTGTTYPLLLYGAHPTGGDLSLLYGPYDNFVIIDAQGTVRYHAALLWPLGNRYHLDEIRATVDALVTDPTGVPDVPIPPGLFLAASPNPFRASTSVELTNPTQEELSARIMVHDLNGRAVARLWNGPVRPGRVAVRWNGHTEDGRPLASGLYLLRADLGPYRLSRRITLLR
jgi:hypothetical protein